jgi:WD40 repeat protein
VLQLRVLTQPPDIDWSQLNDSLASVSSDKTLRIWDTKTGKLIRTITDDSPIHCCRFHPENNNAIVTGNGRGVLKVYNSSTGKLLQTISIGSIVKCITFNTRGDLMFLGDSEGFVRWYEYDLVEFHWRGQKKIIETKGKSINSISFREFHTAMSSAEWPAVLISANDNSMRLFRLVDSNNLQATDNLNKTSLTLEPRSHYIVKNQTANVRSCFCPAISNRTVGCIVSGSEPGSVLIVAYPALLTGNAPITPRDKNNKVEAALPVTEAGEPMTLVNQLQGHGGTCTAVDWDYDESLLATADATGLVIIWKTKKNVPKSP